MYYIYLIVSFVLGQALYTAVTVWRIQKDLSIDYNKALKEYVKKELGGYIVSGIFMLILLFILPELLDLKMTRDDLKTIQERNWAQTVQFYFRCAMVVLGMFSTHVAYSAYKRGKKGIVELDKKIGNDPE